MNKYKLHVSIKGSLIRERYFNTVTVRSNNDDEEYLRTLAYLTLKGDAFPDITKDDVKINAIIVCKQ